MDRNSDIDTTAVMTIDADPRIDAYASHDTEVRCATRELAIEELASPR